MHYVFPALLLWLTAVVYRVLLNTFQLRKLRALKIEHVAYMQALSDDEGKQSWEFVQKSTDLKVLFEKAGIANQSFTRIEQVGYGYTQPRTAMLFDNFGANHIDIQQSIVNAFNKAESVYLSRRREAFSFFYWTDTLLHMPATILRYIGLESPTFGKAANVIAWIVGVVGFFTSLPDFVNFQRWVSQHLAALVGVFHR